MKIETKNLSHVQVNLVNINGVWLTIMSLSGKFNENELNTDYQEVLTYIPTQV